MKLTAILLLVGCLHATAGALSQKVTLSSEKVPLEKIFNQIRKQTGYVFLIETGLMKKTSPVSIKVEDASLDEVMKACLKDQGLSYKIVGTTIILKEKTAHVELQEAYAPPPVTLRGKVIDAKTNAPVADASVKVHGKRLTITTNRDGEFTLSVETGDVLEISFIGYENKLDTVRGGGSRLFKLEQTSESLKETVVTGVITRNASTFTGASSTFTQDELLRVGNQNIVQSLRNLDPAFQIVDNLQIGSNPNQLPDIQLRGQSGFPDLNGEYRTNPNLPLFVLDGFETTLQRVIDLDPYRIARVTILKDAASKAIYGARAANGVVVIETLRPAAGKIQISYNGNMNIEAPDLSSYNLTNASEKLDVERAGGIYSSNNASVQYALLQKYNAYNTEIQSGVNTYWLAKPLRTGIGQRHSVRLEGGDSYFRYGIDFGYNKVAGAMKGSARNTYSGGINLVYRYKGFSFQNLLTVSFNNASNSPYGSFSQFAAMNPYLRATDSSGRIVKVAGSNLAAQGGGGAGATTATNVYNPLWNGTINTKDVSGYTDVTNNLQIDWRINSMLRATGRFGITKRNSTTEVFLPATHTNFITYTTPDLIFRKGTYTNGYGKESSYTGNVTLSYIRTLGKSTVNANIGGEINERKDQLITYTVEGFPNENISEAYRALQYLKDSRPAGNQNTIRDIGGYAAVNYSFDDKYLADLSYRSSASSQYGSNKRWGQFWSAGLGWNLHNEAFMKSLQFVDKFRLRGSTGYTGSQGFNSYMSLSTYTYYTNNSYYNANGAYLIGLANPDLQWQKKQDNNIGADLSLFKKLDLRVDYYVSNTTGLLIDVSLPPSTGFSTYKANLGQTQNKGIEAWFNYRVFANAAQRSSLSVFASLLHNTNKVLKISNALSAYNKKQDTAISSKPKVRYTPGQSLSAIWAVPSRGIDPTSGKEVLVAQDGNTTNTWNAADQVVLGDRMPAVSGNFGFTLDYSGFILSSSFRYQLGGQLYNQTLVDKVENANIYNNVDRRVFTGRWRQPGDVAQYKNIADKSVTLATGRFVQDNNQLALASVNLTYDLDRFKAIKRAGFSRLRVGFNTNELFVASSVWIERGTDYPFARTFSFTVQAMF